MLSLEQHLKFHSQADDHGLSGVCSASVVRSAARFCPFYSSFCHIFWCLYYAHIYYIIIYTEAVRPISSPFPLCYCLLSWDKDENTHAGAVPVGMRRDVTRTRILASKSTLLPVSKCF